jgi:hypothetical protein
VFIGQELRCSIGQPEKDAGPTFVVLVDSTELRLSEGMCQPNECQPRPRAPGATVNCIYAVGKRTPTRTREPEMWERAVMNVEVAVETRRPPTCGQSSPSTSDRELAARATVNCISAVVKRTPTWLGRHRKIQCPVQCPQTGESVTLGEISSRNETVSDWGYVGCLQFGQFVIGRSSVQVRVGRVGGEKRAGALSGARDHFK